LRAHSVDCGADLFNTPQIGSKPDRLSSSVLNFKLSEFKLGLAPSQQTDTGASRRKSYGNPLPDTAARACNQDADILK
jgi:hypothetical protein